MRLSRPVAAFALAATLAACGESPTPTASAPEAPQRIEGGVPTGSSYGNVGGLLMDYNGNGTIEGSELTCTGSLISPTVFLTAAHCVVGYPADAQFYVSFDAEMLPAPAQVIAATGYHYDPAYGRDLGDLHDIAVVLLPAGSTAGITPLQLPSAGYLDALAAQNGLDGVSFVNVGYGVSASKTGAPAFGYDGVRKVSTSPFSNLQETWLNLLMATPATGEGGDCYGDSGSPKFIEGQTHMALAIVSTGDYPCRATSRSYRLDSASARAFLGQFVALP